LEVQRDTLTAESPQRGGQRAELPEPRGTAAAPVTDKEASLPATEAAELQFQAPTERAPVDLNEVFRRVGATIDLPEEEPVAQVPARSDKGDSPIFADTKTGTVPAKTPPAGRTAQRNAVTDDVPARAAAVSATEEGAEESIDDYMNRLMQRVRASSGESQDSPCAMQRVEPIRAARDAPARVIAAEPSEPQPAPSMAAAEANEPEPVQPRPRVPAKPINLDALRELANMSAKSAISQHARRTLIRTMYGKLALAAVALAAAVGLFWLWKQYGACEITLYSSLVAIVVALLSGVEYARLTGRLIIGKKGRDDAGDPPAGEP
jgi:hypothetical protein